MTNFELGPMGVFEHPYDRPSSKSAEVYKLAQKPDRHKERELKNSLCRETAQSSVAFLEQYIGNYGTGRVPAILRSDLEFFENQLVNTDSEGNILLKDSIN